MDPATITRSFYSLPSRILGGVGLLLAAVVALTGLIDRGSGISFAVIALMVLGAVLVWAALIRQRLVLTDTTVSVHSVFTDAEVPLVRIEDIWLTQVLTLRLDDGTKLVSAAVGRTRRQQHRDTKRAQGGRGMMGGLLGQARPVETVAPRPHYDTLVVTQLRDARDAARARARRPAPGTPASPEGPGVVRRLAWPEIVLASVSLVATVVLFAAGV